MIEHEQRLGFFTSCAFIEINLISFEQNTNLNSSGRITKSMGRTIPMHLAAVPPDRT